LALSLRRLRRLFRLPGASKSKPPFGCGVVPMQRGERCGGRWENSISLTTLSCTCSDCWNPSSLGWGLGVRGHLGEHLGARRDPCFGWVGRRSRGGVLAQCAPSPGVGAPALGVVREVVNKLLELSVDSVCNGILEREVGMTLTKEWSDTDQTW